MKIGIIIPDRGDREELLFNCLRMMGKQTMKPEVVEIVNYEPIDNNFDLTARVKMGFESAKKKGCDCVLIIENDDYYCTTYIETMINEWVKVGKPDIFGTNYTYYYHLFLKQYRKLDHPNRASLMNTLISCSATIDYPVDDYIFLDLYLWKKLNGKTFTPKQPLSIGIKHGIGLCGGGGHKRMTFDSNDLDLKFLTLNTDKESFEFYKKMTHEKYTPDSSNLS